MTKMPGYSAKDSLVKFIKCAGEPYVGIGVDMVAGVQNGGMKVHMGAFLLGLPENTEAERLHIYKNYPVHKPTVLSHHRQRRINVHK
jgi:hypothetical protein